MAFFKKSANTDQWVSVSGQELSGPAYAVLESPDKTIWIGNWQGLFKLQNNVAEKITGPEGPISLISQNNGEIYALGPKGFWIRPGTQFQKIKVALPGSVRDALPDEKGGIWIATDAGLFYWSKNQFQHYYKTNELISGYAKGLAFDPKGQLWVGGLGGVTIRDSVERKKNLFA